MPSQKGHPKIVGITVHYLDRDGNICHKDIPDIDRWIALAWDRTGWAHGQTTHFFSEYHHHEGQQEKKGRIEKAWKSVSPNPGELPLLLMKDPECNSDPLYPD